MTYIHLLAPSTPADVAVLGGKGAGLVTLMRLGLPVPSGFVISPAACREFLRTRQLPAVLRQPVAMTMSNSPATTTGGPAATATSVPATTVKSTLADRALGTHTAATATIAAARSTATIEASTAATAHAAVVSLADAMRGLEAATGRRFGGTEEPLLVSVRSGAAVSMPGMMTTVLDVAGPSLGQLQDAVEAVFASWHSPRAVSYREVHDIPHDLGTAVVIQAMVRGDRDEHSGSGVAFSRDPGTGARTVFGDVLFGHRGDDVVSGRVATRPLGELADREPAVWSALLDGLDRVERHYRDVCHVEFTYESGRLWFLQVRPGGLTGRAAVRAAVDLTDEGIIDRATAVRRVSSRQIRAARTPRIRVGTRLLARGVGASPGVASGRIAFTADRAARMAADGPVILVRPYTSPLDMHGLAAAAGIVTTVGGPTSHAAVVARSMGRPAVVGATALTVDPETGHVHAADGSFPEGTLFTIDGTGGDVVVGPAETTDGEADPHLDRLLSWAALADSTTTDDPDRNRPPG